MYNKVINLATIGTVAEALQELRESMVFIGGAVISLYTDDPAADEIRPTKDIDLTIDLGNHYSEFAKMQERLGELGIHPDPEGESIASYKYQDISIDIMPAEDTAIGISNTWYKPGFAHLEQVTLENGLSINLLPAPYFLATKLEAFIDRGKGDYYGSHDFEDIIYLLDNRTTIVKEVAIVEDALRQYIAERLTAIKNERGSEEILLMHIHPLIREQRGKLLLEKFEALTNIDY